MASYTEAPPSPSGWSVDQVKAWAMQVKLSEEVVSILARNEVDGATLVTLSKEELRGELGIQSLPARRYIWSLIENLRSQQQSADLRVAIEAHQGEIDAFERRENPGTTALASPDESGGGTRQMASVDHYEVLDLMRSDAGKQRQVLEDHMLAHRLQSLMVPGQQGYEDFNYAVQEQERLDHMRLQSEYDHRFALSLQDDNNAPRRARRALAEDVHPSEDETRSLFGLCIDSCVKNKVNVRDALLNDDRIKPIEPYAQRQGAESPDSFSDDRKPPAKPRAGEGEKKLHPVVASLPFINRCDVCYETAVKGFSLPCDKHKHCVGCMTNYLKAALNDSSLLPLKCCDLPIDSSVASVLLDKADAHRLQRREQELQAEEKMYCPTCHCFINLDLVDNTWSWELTCPCCGAQLCTGCRSAAHPGLDCATHKARSHDVDAPVLALAEEQGWRQCPKCSILIELVTGCNHMVCGGCQHEFCFNCLRAWARGGNTCASGNCQLWDEDRLLEAGEARIQGQEAVLGRRYDHAERANRIGQEMDALRGNEDCVHDWVRRWGYSGNCERCGYDLWVYGYVCSGTCHSTVCYTCANHRIPARGWR